MAESGTSRPTLAIAHAALRAPGVSDPRHYARRVHWLAIVHAALFVAVLGGLVLLIWHGQLFVTLAQRSNIETLTIAFFLVFFAYFAIVTAPGAWGAIRIGWFAARLALARDKAAVERARMAALGTPERGAVAAFDKSIEIEQAPHASWEIEVRDEVGSMGRLRFDGVRVEQLDIPRGGSNTLLGYVEHKLGELTGAEIEIVQWASTDEETLHQYVATATALRALGRSLNAESWPTLVISEDTRRALEREVGELCGALRSELFLPDWEFQGEHKLPIIPEPLGIISLSRSERRVDPLSSLTAALVIVLLVVGLLCFFIVRPPWVPGH